MARQDPGGRACRRHGAAADRARRREPALCRDPARLPRQDGPAGAGQHQLQRARGADRQPPGRMRPRPGRRPDRFRRHRAGGVQPRSSASSPQGHAAAAARPFLKPAGGATIIRGTIQRGHAQSLATADKAREESHADRSSSIARGCAARCCVRVARRRAGAAGTMAHARAVSGAVRGSARHGGERQDVRVRRPRAGVEAEGAGLRIRPGEQCVGAEEADAAALAPRRLHRAQRQDLRVRRLQVARERPARLGPDRQCVGIRSGRRYLEGARAAAIQARRRQRRRAQRQDLRHRRRRLAARREGERHPSGAAAQRGRDRRRLRPGHQHLELGAPDAARAQSPCERRRRRQALRDRRPRRQRLHLRHQQQCRPGRGLRSGDRPVDRAPAHADAAQRDRGRRLRQLDRRAGRRDAELAVSSPPSRRSRPTTRRPTPGRSCPRCRISGTASRSASPATGSIR